MAVSEALHPWSCLHIPQVAAPASLACARRKHEEVCTPARTHAGTWVPRSRKRGPRGWPQWLLEVRGRACVCSRARVPVAPSMWPMCVRGVQALCLDDLLAGRQGGGGGKGCMYAAAYTPMKQMCCPDVGV